MFPTCFARNSIPTVGRLPAPCYALRWLCLVELGSQVIADLAVHAGWIWGGNSVKFGLEMTAGWLRRDDEELMFMYALLFAERYQKVVWGRDRSAW